MVGSSSNENEFRVKMWTSSDLLRSDVSESAPRILYVSVTHVLTQLPVLRARVRVHCSVIGNDDDVTKVCDDTQLLDNGGGDADITADDGVYSR